MEVMQERMKTLNGDGLDISTKRWMTQVDKNGAQVFTTRPEETSRLHDIHTELMEHLELDLNVKSHS